METKQKQSYKNPYLSGFMLGIILLAALTIAKHGLSASAAIRNLFMYVLQHIYPTYIKSSEYYSFCISNFPRPLMTWGFIEVIGIIIGSFLSSIIAGRLSVQIDKGPQITKKSRLVFALIGGTLAGIGARFARGCTSGAALTGMAVFSVSGFITTASIFGTAYLIAYFIRKNWI